MGSLATVAYVVGALFVGWLVYRRIKHDRAAFSAANLSRSAMTLGVLALGLIGFIAVLVLLLRQG